MKIQYEAIFRIDLGKAVPAVGELCKSVNDNLATYGVQERMIVTAEPFSFVVSVNRELNEQEQYTMRTLLEAEVVKSFHQYDVRLVSFCRKSGNVSQSVTQ
jgi:hypothetical protein